MANEIEELAGLLHEAKELGDDIAIGSATGADHAQKLRKLENILIETHHRIMLVRDPSWVSPFPKKKP